MLTKKLLNCSTTVEGEGCSVRMQHEERLGIDNAFNCFPLSSLSSLKVCLESPIQLLNLNKKKSFFLEFFFLFLPAASLA